jgi:hypothetical protein
MWKFLDYYNVPQTLATASNHFEAPVHVNASGAWFLIPGTA